MKQETMEKAIAITHHRELLNEELRSWNKYAIDGVVSPLTFRLGNSINYITKESFEQFRAANVSWLKAAISQLDSEFANL